MGNGNMSAGRAKAGRIRRKARYETARGCVVKRGISWNSVDAGARFARQDADSSGENDTAATISQTKKRNSGAMGGDWAKKNTRKDEIPDTSKSRVPPDLRFSDLKIPENSGAGRSGKRKEGQVAETTWRIRDSGNTTARIEEIPEPRGPELPDLRRLSPRDSRNPGIPGGRVLEPRNPGIRKSPSDKAARTSRLKRARTTAGEKRRGDLRIHICNATAGEKRGGRIPTLRVETLVAGISED